MKRLLRTVLFLQLLAVPALSEETMRVELNALEAAQDNCRMTFVLENKASKPIDSLKLDLAMFNKEGAVKRQLAMELGPVRASKTIVRSFVVDGACAQVGAILVNDIVACAPAEPHACLE